jgi:hypothetical protein
LHIPSEAECVKRGTSGCQVEEEGRDLLGLCLQEAITPLKDSFKAHLEDILIDSTTNGSEGLLMVEPPQMGTHTSGMCSFRPRVC